MSQSFKHFLLNVGIHAYKNKPLIARLEEHWVCEELAAHGRYSPFLLEVQIKQDYAKHLPALLLSFFGLLFVGLLLCSFSSFWVQGLGVMVCLLGSTGLINLCTKNLQIQNTNANTYKLTFKGALA